MNNGVLPQRPEFEVTVSTEDGVRVVAVSGELDLDTMGELNAVLADDEGLVTTTVVDLRGLPKGRLIVRIAAPATPAGAWSACRGRRRSGGSSS